MAPVYRAGTQLVIAPEERPRIGDRVMVKNRDGQISAWELGVSSVQSVSLIPLNPLHPDRQVPLGDVLWIARIVWASQ
jgi:phage repressor protein C with HTH and peptisase S24 domain